MQQVAAAWERFEQQSDKVSSSRNVTGDGGMAELAALVMSALSHGVWTDRKAVSLMIAAVGDQLPQQLVDLGTAVCCAACTLLLQQPLVWRCRQTE